MKTPDECFLDWHEDTFGFGYGTGEPHIIEALWKFFGAFKSDNRSYDYRDLEKAVRPAVAWLLINVLCHHDHIEYGTSPRFGWLTDSGKTVSNYIRSHQPEELLVILDGDDHDYCGRTYCNCDPPSEGRCKNNPMFEGP